MGILPSTDSNRPGNKATPPVARPRIHGVILHPLPRIPCYAVDHSLINNHQPTCIVWTVFLKTLPFIDSTCVEHVFPVK